MGDYVQRSKPNARHDSTCCLGDDIRRCAKDSYVSYVIQLVFLLCYSLMLSVVPPAPVPSGCTDLCCFLGWEGERAPLGDARFKVDGLQLQIKRRRRRRRGDSLPLFGFGAQIVTQRQVRGVVIERVLPAQLLHAFV